MQDETIAQKPGARRWVRIVLFVSLAFNLLVVGAAGSAFFIHGERHKHHGGGFGKMGGPLTHALSPEDRKKVRKKLHEAYEESGAGFRQYKQEKAKLIVVLTAEQFDAEAARGHLEQMQGIVSTRLLQGREVLLERLTEMTLQERQAFAERLQKRHKKHRKN
ncbi:periplasmic heavy metal sensor [Roseovarius sp. EL26]|uniref:periplasmic heavy metal sensor n=1 Tax=Roseovarius sp. EL26 TaxID=2126672 RepID=UPI000EA0B180|nr:periplasmic heavy metal sensor [Roseovarius sp. EL26]